jgi:hypothetical protein
MTIEELEKLLAVYLKTKDHKDWDDWYATEYMFAAAECEKFIEWLKKLPIENRP